MVVILHWKFNGCDITLVTDINSNIHFSLPFLQIDLELVFAYKLL